MVHTVYTVYTVHTVHHTVHTVYTVHTVHCTSLMIGAQQQGPDKNSGLILLNIGGKEFMTKV